MEFKEFFTEVGKCVEIVDKYTGQEIEHMEVALFEGRLRKLFDDLTKPALRPKSPPSKLMEFDSCFFCKDFGYDGNDEPCCHECGKTFEKEAGDIPEWCRLDDAMEPLPEVEDGEVKG